MTDQLDYASPIEYEALWSHERDHIVKALFDFQQKIGSINKTQTAVIKTDKGTYEYTFADLNDTIDSVLPLLDELNLYLDWGVSHQDCSKAVRSLLALFSIWGSP